MPTNQKSNTEQASNPKSILPRLILATVIAILLGVYEDVADPFGLDTYTERLSANIFSTITSPFYGKRSHVEIDDQEYPSRRGQANILTLLVDDAYLAQSSQTWPISPTKYKRLLRKLSTGGSSAVYVDIYFNRTNEAREKKIAQLFKYADELEQDTGTAMIFASTLHDPQPTAKGVNTPQSALARLRSDYNVYPLQQTAMDGKVYDSAGWALYRAWCKRNAQQCDADKLEHFPGDDMYLHWGFTPNHVMTDIPEFRGERCKKQSESLLGEFRRSVDIFLWNAFKGLQEEGPNSASGNQVNTMAPCPYHTQLSLTLFNNLTSSEVKQLVENRIVILGTSLTLHQDTHASPVQGYIPGVFWHAMAADNLIEFSDGYMKSAEGGISEYAEPIGITIIFLLQALLTWRIDKVKRLGDPRHADPQLLEFCHGLSTLCLIALSVLAITGLMRWSPANWIGLAMLMFVINPGAFTALWSYSHSLYPISMGNRSLGALANGIKAFLISATIVLLCYILFILPHALLLSRDYNDTAVCYGFMVFYGAIAIAAILKTWTPTTAMSKE